MGPDRGLRRQTCISLTSTAADRRVLDPLGRTGMNYFFSDLGNLRVEIAGDSPSCLSGCAGLREPRSHPQHPVLLAPRGRSLRSSETAGPGRQVKASSGYRGRLAVLRTVTLHSLGLGDSQGFPTCGMMTVPGKGKFCG